MYYVYKVENLITGQCYIGMTPSPRERHLSHLRNSSNRYLRESVKKYGRENFSFTIIGQHENRGQSLIIEDEYIKHYNALRPTGFNMILNNREDWDRICKQVWAIKPLIPFGNGHYKRMSQATGIDEARIKRALCLKRALFTKAEQQKLSEYFNVKIDV